MFGIRDGERLVPDFNIVGVPVVLAGVGVRLGVVGNSTCGDAIGLRILSVSLEYALSLVAVDRACDKVSGRAEPDAREDTEEEAERGCVDDDVSSKEALRSI